MAEIGFGRSNAFPFTFGGGESVVESLYAAEVKALEPAWSVDDDPMHDAECWAYANAVAAIWAVNERVGNQAIPERMLEHLPVWEQVLRLRPAPTDTDVDRRRRVAGKLRGLANSTDGDVRDSVAALLGNNFDEIVFADPADVVVYWPSVNPGPPGREWSTNRAVLGVRMNRAGLSDDAFAARRAAVVELLDSMLASWMGFSVGTGADGFICDVGICDETFL